MPALNYARRDRELGRLTEDGEQFVFRATREILEDLNSLKPQSSSKVSDSSQPATIDENSPVILPKVRILGCPLQDEADELALLMFRQLLDSTRYEIEVIGDAVLTSEVAALVVEKSPVMIFIATVSPAGLAQTRYLCKRLRVRFPNLKIAVGRWGMGSEDRNSILLAGADRVGTTMTETREQLIQLCQIAPHSEAQSATRGPACPPSQRDVFPKAVA